MSKLHPFWIKPEEPYKRVWVYRFSIFHGFGWASEKAYWYPLKQRWEVHSMYYIPHVICWKEDE